MLGRLALAILSIVPPTLSMIIVSSGPGRANQQRTNLGSSGRINRIPRRQSTRKSRGSSSRRTGDNGSDCDAAAVQEASLRLSKLRMEEAILVEQLLHHAVVTAAHRRQQSSSSGGEEEEIRSTTIIAPQINKDYCCCSKSSSDDESNGSNSDDIGQRQQQQHVLFPSVRQCNSALATFGDVGDFSRALRLFAQMRKSSSMISSRRKKMEEDDDIDNNDDESSGTNVTTNHVIDNDEINNLNNNINHVNNNVIKDERVLVVPFCGIDMVQNPPKPTLVTYSALMSRAISLHKPKVALRLWNLMKNQVNFYTQHVKKDNNIKRQSTGAQNSSSSSSSSSTITIEKFDEDILIPDVILCNTLMNAYAKLGNHEAARSILNAMIIGGDDDRVSIISSGIPPTNPTVVTYNTLADACKVAGDLGAALEVPELMIARAKVTGDTSLLPDAQTYTILISTVARKPWNCWERRDVRSGGEKDPDQAFALLQRMIGDGIIPNGVTYCALIDVCGRCSRTDLALAGLRLMLKQKSQGREMESAYNRQTLLFNEVGAWTAAINACGKTRRTDTAIRLFRTMQKYGVKPNSVTCGCLADCLLKAIPIRMTETLEVLQYMKYEKLTPTEVMFTSQIGILSKLADKSVIRKNGLKVKIIDKLHESRHRNLSSSETSTQEAINLYSELMRLLINDGNDSSMQMKVFLVFQEMKQAGVKADLACFNSLLKVCALSGDIDNAHDVLRQMKSDGIEATPNTWRGALKAAREARSSDFADSIWDAAVTYESKDVAPFAPQVLDIKLLLSVYVSEISTTSDHTKRNILNKKIITLYEDIIIKSEERGLHYESLNVDKVEENQEFMLAVLRAAVSVELHGLTLKERSDAKEIACEIAGFELFQGRLKIIDKASEKALKIAQDWLYSY